MLLLLASKQKSGILQLYGLNNGNKPPCCPPSLYVNYQNSPFCIFQMIFDPNMTKKKKKKKKPFMLDGEGVGGEDGEGVGGEETKEVETKEAEPEPGEDKELDLDDDDSRKKGWSE